MKSVKNFFSERMNSTDPSSSTSSLSVVGSNPNSKHQLEKLKTPDKNFDGPQTAPPLMLSASSTSALSSADDNGHPLSPAFLAVSSDSSITSVYPESGHHPLCSTKSESLALTMAAEQQKDADAFASEENELNLPPLALASKTQKSRRKISLPWFRQTSVTSSHAVLSRQHTIDSPGSFRMFRQSSSVFKVGALEATWVVSDYIATPGSNELSVVKGQQVEVIEIATATDPDFCLVRLNPQNNDDPVHEGLVPVSILKPPPGLQKGTSNKKETDSIQEQNNVRGKPDPLTSSTKRRGFSGRKWLPQPLRKLSQGKVDKPPMEKTLTKKASERNLKLSTKHAEHGDELTSSIAGSITPTSAQQYMSQVNNSQQPDYEPEEEVGLELPPPMKPIQDACLISNGPPAFKDMKENPVNLAGTFKKMEGNAAADLSEIEQIVKEKTEQHEVNSIKIIKPLDISSTDSNGRDLDLCYANNDNSEDNNDENNSETNDVEAAQRKRLCALSELLSTEELYIQDLAQIVNGYIGEIRNPKSDIPEDLKGGKERVIFGNIEAIYEWHRDNFLKSLQRCIKTPSELGPMIKRYEVKFRMYNVYCQNKPLSEHVLSEHVMYFDQIRQKLKHRLDLSDLLIKPVQRITKYELLLREIKKQTERAKLVEEVPSMEEACDVMKVVCRAVNDMMVVRRLQKFGGQITAQGKLLLHGPLVCVEEQKNSERNATMVQKPRELQVFLFEQSIILADIVGKKTQFTSPSYVYRTHLQVNKMHLEELPNNKFLLKSTDPNRPDLYQYVCNAATVKQNHEWLETIRNILQNQNNFLNALQSPIEYQKKLTKDS